MAIDSPDSELDICNMSLNRVGAQVITLALLTADSDPRAMYCNLHYAQTRDALLRSHWWRFAKARRDLKVVTNGDFAHWTSDDPDDWTLTETAALDEVSQVGSGQGHGGTGQRMCNIYSTADGTGVFMTQTVTTVVGLEYKFSININTITAGEVGVLGLPTGNVTYDETGVKTVTFTADATSFVLTISGGTAVATDITFDNVSIYNVPAFEWSYGYVLPSDFLREKSVYEDNATIHKNTVYSYELEGNLLLTDESECNLRYIKQVTDVTLFDPLFLEVFILQLAIKFSYPLAGVGSAGRALVAEIKDELYRPNGLMARVRTIDRQEGERIGRGERVLWNTSRSSNMGRIDSKLGSA